METVGEAKQRRSRKPKETVSKETVSEEKGEVSAEEESKPVKKKGKPRGGNSPVIGNNGLQTQPGDTAHYLALNMELFNLPVIDMQDTDQVANRLNEYFEIYARYDTKPTVAGMAMALNGHNRTWLLNIVNDMPTGGCGYKANLPPEVASLIKKAYEIMENLWENYMENGKLNPVTGIFLGKNNFKYRDQTEYVVSPNNERDSDYSPDEIRARYEPNTAQRSIEQKNDAETSENL